MTEEPEAVDNGEQVVERIKRSEMKPMNDPRCEHLFEEDPDGDEFGNYKAMKCMRCPIGIFVPK